MFTKYFIPFILIYIFIFNGCSSKLNTTSQNTITQSQQIVSEDNDMDEFEDEFEEDEIAETSDPLYGYNVWMTNINDKLYINVFNPIAKGYKSIVPKGGRESVNNFFHNILYPIRFINNIFQGKIANASEETGRFVINTTIGIFGLFDPAQSYFHLKPHNEDFGQTLGFWGVGSGYHIVLPFFGPSNMRDMFSMYPDTLASPIAYDEKRGYNLVDNYDKTLALTAYQKLNYISLHLGEYEDLKKDSVELYPFLKDIYEQHRKKLIEE
jgi:phospholipid-binding lipoprotein MlaA